MKGQHTQQPDIRTQRKNSHSITNKGTRQTTTLIVVPPPCAPARTDLRSKVSAKIVETFIKYDTFVSLKPETGWIFGTEKSRYKSKNNKSCQGFACKFILTLTSRFFSVTKKRGVSVRPQCQERTATTWHYKCERQPFNVFDWVSLVGNENTVERWRLLSFFVFVAVKSQTQKNEIAWTVQRYSEFSSKSALAFLCFRRYSRKRKKAVPIQLNVRGSPFVLHEFFYISLWGFLLSVFCLKL